MNGQIYLQQDQPPGVPPLTLTGERTLPDVPQENYWFRRHLVAYQWIAQQVTGLQVVDMACGEGYGSDVLARSAREVVGVDANPEAHEHARLRYQRRNLSFERELIERFDRSCDAVVFLQTIEHVQNPGAVLDNFARLAPLLFLSTPNVRTLAPPGADKSHNPWHIKEYTQSEFELLCREHYERVEIYGVFHARKLRLHELAIRAGWDSLHARLGFTEAFYDRFTPAIDVRDFTIRPASAGSLEGALDFLAVLHT